MICKIPEAIIQKASKNPSAVKMVNSPMMRGIKIAAMNATSAATHKRFNKTVMLVLFQFAQGPTANKNRAGIIIGTNTALKYGGPTEILPRFNASMSKGYKVPNKTDPAATTKKTLPMSMSVSRDIKENAPPKVLLGALKAYKNNEEPTTRESKIRIKIPRRGSVAKA